MRSVTGLQPILLSTTPPGPGERRLALAVVLVSLLVFVAAVPFARVQLPPVAAFMPIYQSALAINDLITAVLLFAQFAILRSRALLALACGYLFTASMVVVHTLSFPGLFSATGLLGAGPQTTAWLYMFWHGGFPLLVITYALLKGETGSTAMRGKPFYMVLLSSIAAVAAAVAGLSLIATAGHGLLPAIMGGNSYNPIMMLVVATVWISSFLALLVLWLRRPHSKLDLWLMVVMCAWVFDVGLSAVFNAGRYDLGFYAGRVYGLMAATFVLVVLLLEMGGLYARLARLLEVEHYGRMRESEQRRRIFETSLDLILVVDRRGMVVQVSPSSATILGYAPAQMIGRNAADFICPNDLEVMVKEMRLARRGHMIRDLETRHAHKDGHIVTMAWSGVWSEPEQRHFFIGRDMTERKLADEALKQALARQEAVFNSAIVGILTVNDNGSVETLNPAAQQLFGCADHALAQLDVGRLIDLAGPHHLGSGEQLREMLKSGPRVHELTGRRSDGSSFPLDVLLTEMPIGERRLFLVFVRDITERKRNERLKDEFVATVSHELRTPLASIAGALALLAGGAAGQIPDAARRLLTIAHANSQRLVRLINDILDIERLEAGKMELDLRPVDVKPLVEQAIEANAGFSDGFHVRVRLEAGAHEAVVRADADRLMQVLVNLLSNAVKFSPPGEEVVVSIEERDGPVRIAVRDRGAGIPDDFKDRIFEKFAQADATDTRQRGGTGLGLSIVKQIVIQLGGDIGFEAAPGGGTSFHIDLPRWHGTAAADTFQHDRRLPAA